MPDFSDRDSIFAIEKNVSASNAEFSDVLNTRVSHICDLAFAARTRLCEKIGDVSVSEAVLSGDEARVLIGEFFASLPRGDDGDETNAPMFRALKNFDAMVFCRALVEGEKVDFNSISNAIFGAAEPVPNHSSKRVALLNNAQSSRAFELFAAEIRGAISSYEDNFQSACEAVYARDVQYAVIPVSSNADGRLDGLYRMMEKYGLVVNMTCRVSQSDGGSTCFALAGRPTHAIISHGRVKFEFKITFDDVSELTEMAEAAGFFGAALERADALPGIYGRDNTFGFVLDVDNADVGGLFVYAAMRFPRLVPIGIYSHITEE